MTADNDATLLPAPKEGEHPFAPYVRILGKGKRGSRSLNFEEARHAMAMILRGEVEDVQLGAFLMLLRVKEETPEELAGFVQAVREQSQAPAGLEVDIDWSSYAGKRRHAPWFLFSILLLADHGLRVFIHGAEGHTPERIYLSEALEEFGFAPARHWSEVSDQLDSQGFSYLPLRCFAENLANMIDLRPVMGLRSPVHSLARLINPLSAPTVLQGIFHPPYAGMHQEAGLLLGYPRVAVIRGEGGEIERNPDNALKVFRARIASSGEQALSEEEWPPLFDRRHVKPKDISPESMRRLWRGEVEDSYGEAAVISTAAFALLESGCAMSQSEAMSQAQDLWSQRDRGRF
ncbi:glycosyl transferase family protein [Marinobacter zhejiangensis]|uniref:Anthranilate phosphoribosyltransferase n=1 Tax=Marinobacter zhejiangensis TaxID=488535 RepID=A0A1I4RW95_9GAMM|nr:glycosyl transferase family protein [Marinobacter zhejiangensis]SFM56290.1 Anthranilate phosphoribosyltransferase [Marinobacter zhejiangensis]